MLKSLRDWSVEIWGHPMNASLLQLDITLWLQWVINRRLCFYRDVSGKNSD